MEKINIAKDTPEQVHEKIKALEELKAKKENKKKLKLKRLMGIRIRLKSHKIENQQAIRKAAKAVAVATRPMGYRPGWFGQQTIFDKDKKI